MRERLARIFGAAASMQMEENTPRGAVVRLTLPVVGLPAPVPVPAPAPVPASVPAGLEVGPVTRAAHGVSHS
ncbi:hypothetical protein ACU4GD_39440 [Cupriavidus basilensis]